MTDDGQALINELNERLKEILLRHVPRPAVLPGPVDGVFLVRREAVNCSESCFTRPLASLIVQGGKKAVLGSREYTIRANQCLLAAVDMPSLSHAVDPTPERPFLSLFFYLDRQMLGELIMAMTPEERAAGVDDSGVAVADADPDLMESVLRLAELLDKPRDRRDAAEMLAALSGREHTVYTGVTVRRGGETVTEHEATAVRFRPLTRGEIEDYVSTGEPMDKAGAYGIQGYGCLLVEGITGDYFNVVGLPVCRLGRILARFGVDPLARAAQKEREL